jgi:hypothetical protein
MRLGVVHYVNHLSGYPGCYSTILFQIFIVAIFLALTVFDIYLIDNYNNQFELSGPNYDKFAPLARGALTQFFRFRVGLIIWLTFTQM